MRSERWSDKEEIKAALHCFSEDKQSGGAILHCENGKLYSNNREGNMIILGVPGSGKSRRCTMPMIRALIDAREGFFVIDPKGEIYRETACYLSDAHDIHVFDFRNVFNTECWNPLAYIRYLMESSDPMDKQLGEELIEELAWSLYMPETEDPFWVDSARSLFIGVIRALLECAEPDQITMANAYQFIAKGEQKYAGKAVLQKFVEEIALDSLSGWDLFSYATTASDTRGGIRSKFLEGIAFFTRNTGLLDMLSFDDLHIENLTDDKPLAMYVILPDENSLYDRLAGVLCSQIMSHYLRLAQDKYAGKLPIRLNVCLEELGNIGGAIPNLAKWMTGSRSRNIRIQCVLQSLSQLTNIFGPAQASTIISSADTFVAFRINHWETLTELSRKCGEREVLRANAYVPEPLITQCQLGSMENGQALIIISGRTRYIEWLPDYTEMFDHSQWSAPILHERRQRRPLDFFNLYEYTKMRSKGEIEAIFEKMRIQEMEKNADKPPFDISTADTDKKNVSDRMEPKKGKAGRSGRSGLKGKESIRMAPGNEPVRIAVSKAKECKIVEIAEAISSIVGLDRETVELHLELFSFELTLESPEKAFLFARRIRRLGGKVEYLNPEQAKIPVNAGGTPPDTDSLPF